MSPIEIIATIVGLVSVYLTVKQNIWCWPTGIVMVTLYIFIFYNARLYSDMGLQVVYIFMQIYGWHHWLYGGKKRDDLPVTLLSKMSRMFWFGIVILGTFTLGFIMSTYTNADFAYQDAFTTAMSLVAQFLMAQKILESWILWVTVDIVSIGIYGLKGLYATTILYAVFLGLATFGFFEWKKSLAKQKA